MRRRTDNHQSPEGKQLVAAIDARSAADDTPEQNDVKLIEASDATLDRAP